MSNVKRKNTGIYCFENKINGKRYIGQSYNIERRLYEHEYYLKRGKDKCVALQRAVEKYGIENFEVSILESCLPEEMNEREMYWIDKYKSSGRGGYNISNGGDSGMLGYKHSLEVGRKISAAKKGISISEEHKQKISNSKKGMLKSEETKKRMSENHSRYWLGKSITEEHREHLREAHGGENAYQFGEKAKDSASKYYGVYRSIQKKVNIYWIAQVKYKGEKIYLGMRKDEIESAKLYDAYVIENNLPNPLNFP